MVITFKVLRGTGIHYKHVLHDLLLLWHGIFISDLQQSLTYDHISGCGSY